MPDENKAAVAFLDLLVGLSEGGVKAVNFQPDENETLGFFGKSNEDTPLNSKEYEITRHRTGLMDIKRQRNSNDKR